MYSEGFSSSTDSTLTELDCDHNYLGDPPELAALNAAFFKKKILGRLYGSAVA
jgi:hypothetical protein